MHNDEVMTNKTFQLLSKTPFSRFLGLFVQKYWIENHKNLSNQSSCNPFASSFGVCHAHVSFGSRILKKTNMARRTDCQKVMKTTNLIAENFEIGFKGRSSIRIT